jgi:uncharacterized protein (TIGR02118 family)
MIVLCAYYAGTVNPEHQADYDAYVRNVHLDLVSTWPGLRKLRLLKNDGKPYLDEVPRYYQCFELTYDSMEALEQSLRSPERDETKLRTRADASQFRERFHGEVRHVLYEPTEFSPPITGASPAFLRCAYYKGTVAPANRARFDTYVRDVHMPDVAAWPHLRHLRMMKNDERVFIEEKPQYYQAFELAFESQADMDACMASEARKETRRVAKQDFDSFKGLFEGEVHHVNYRCHDIPVKG